MRQVVPADPVIVLGSGNLIWSAAHGGEQGSIGIRLGGSVEPRTDSLCRFQSGVPGNDDCRESRLMIGSMKVLMGSHIGCEIGIGGPTAEAERSVTGRATCSGRGEPHTAKERYSVCFCRDC